MLHLCHTTVDNHNKRKARSSTGAFPIRYTSRMSISRPVIAPPLFPRRKHAWQWVLPVLLILLFLFTLFWLPLQAQLMEANERQEQLIADTLWVEQTVRFQLSRNEES